MEIPASKARIIYFKHSNENNKPTEFPKYELTLHDEGLVSAKTISLSDDQFILEHLLLGEIAVPRTAVKSIRFFRELNNDE